MNYIVGSGPSGVSCAHALVARGLPVCLIDAGITLEDDRQLMLDRMRVQNPQEWSREDVVRMKEGMSAATTGVVLKRVFGSDFAYRGGSEHIFNHSSTTALMPSLARGGLSNVWGAAMLPYGEKELRGWPVTAAELAPHYAEVLKLSGMATQPGMLDQLCALHTGDFVPLKMSSQAGKLWQRLELHGPSLRKRGIHAGVARLAVQAKRAPQEQGCEYCGMCMYGCPYDFIYSSNHTLRQLERESNFQYQRGVVVERLEEIGGHVKITGYRLDSKAPWEAKADRVFLAAGVLPSTKILLSSQEAFSKPLVIKDSQYFLFPLLQMARTPGVREEQLYTLSQMFLELVDPRICSDAVHLQLYSYNDLIKQALHKSLRWLGSDWLVRQIEPHLLIAQGYLHSDHSSALRVQLDQENGAPRLHVEAKVNPAVSATVRRVVRKLVGEAWALGAFAAEPLLHITPPGRGFHSGGTLPMREKPGEFETDILGRPYGWERLHIVDSSVFPTIPATTITFSAMANAHRIGSLAP